MGGGRIEEKVLTRSILPGRGESVQTSVTVLAAIVVAAVVARTSLQSGTIPVRPCFFSPIVKYCSSSHPNSPFKSIKEGALLRVTNNHGP